MKNKLLPSIILSSICIIVALLLAAVNYVTAPIIKEAQEAKVQETLSKVLSEGQNFVKISTDGLADTVIEAYTEDGGGYVFQIEVKGYKTGLIIMCGVTNEGILSGSEVISSNETMSVEDTLGSAYLGKGIGEITPEIVSSSTLTSKAYYDAVSTALRSFEILKTKEDAK